jgi:(E)-4-hydroxy-3-methylbut-2-enyl-diphosphate synthase
VAAGRGNGMIYREGKAIRRVSEEEIVPALLEEIERFVADKTAGIDTTPKHIATQPALTTVSSFPILK